MSKKGHNVKAVVTAGELRQFVERLERLAADKAAISDDEKVVYAEIKSAGYDPKIVRLAIKRRNGDEQKRREVEDMLQLYLDAIGDLAGTPLGKAGQPN